MKNETLNVPPCATKDGNNESDDENQPAMGYQQTIMVPSMSFYPDFIQILSRFYLDLSRFYPDFIQILFRFYPDFI